MAAASPAAPPSTPQESVNSSELKYVSYTSEEQMWPMIKMIEKDLSEPYSVYTYRYFLIQWPFLCFMCYDGDKMVGCVISKMELHRGIHRGYIGMLAVDAAYRKRAIGSTLVLKTVDAMKSRGVDEVMLETEVTNTAAIALYLRLGFLKDKRLQRYYMNGGDAFRLKVWLKE